MVIPKQARESRLFCPVCGALYVLGLRGMLMCKQGHTWLVRKAKEVVA